MGSCFVVCEEMYRVLQRHWLLVGAAAASEFCGFPFCWTQLSLASPVVVSRSENQVPPQLLQLFTCCMW